MPAASVFATVRAAVRADFIAIVFAVNPGNQRGALRLRPRFRPQLRPSMPAVLGAVAGAALLSSCMVVPRTVTTYDPACRVYARQVTLEAVPINGVLLQCSSTPGGCTTGLVLAGIVSSASVVVSGSIAVVGNVIYWIEKQGQCASAPPAPAPGVGIEDPLLPAPPAKS